MVKTTVENAYQAFFALSRLSGKERSLGVYTMAIALENAIEQILEANTQDLESSREMAVPGLIVNWLKLTPERLENTVTLLKELAKVTDPLQRVMNAPYQLDFTQTYCQRMPLGVTALIYEAFPELGAIAAGLCIKTGNSLVLRGGIEGSNSNQVIAQVLQTALQDSGLPPGCVEYISAEDGSSIEEVVTQEDLINLVIPYGRPSLIQQVVQSATAPVLRSAMGNCYLYWSTGGDLELTRSIILDSHSSKPDPVNAIEKVLIPKNQKPSALLRLFTSLQEEGFTLRGDGDLVEAFPEHLQPIKTREWAEPYLDRIISFKTIDNLSQAVSWINRYSSGHADCITTESYEESRAFAMGVDSALVFINSSPRFDRNPAGNDCVFLGMSNQKGYRRGLIGLDTLTTVKQVVQGEGCF